jgi:hypothetical protein
MTISVVILNLKSSTTRRAEISARLDHLGIQYSFFDAIDGRALSANEREDLAPSSALLFDRPLIATEIGCAASHFAAIRQLAAKNHEFRLRHGRRCGTINPRPSLFSRTADTKGDTTIRRFKNGQRSSTMEKASVAGCGNSWARHLCNGAPRVGSTGTGLQP